MLSTGAGTGAAAGAGAEAEAGTFKVWPTLMLVVLMLFADCSALMETWKCLAMLVSVSPDFTL